MRMRVKREAKHEHTVKTTKTTLERLLFPLPLGEGQGEGPQATPGRVVHRCSPCAWTLHGLGPAPAVAAVFVALAVLTSAIPVAQVWLGKILLDQLALVVGGAALALSVILLTAALYALTMGMQTALEPVQEVLTAWLEDRAVGAFDRRLMVAGGRLIDLYHVERPSFQDDLAVVQFGSYTVPRLPTFLQSGLRPALTLAGLLFLLARLHPFIPLILMLATVPYLISERRMAKNRQTVIAKQSRAAREMEYYTQVTTEPQPAKEVRVFGLGNFFLRRFEERRIQALRELDRVRLIHLRSNGFFGALYALALGGGFWYVAAQAGAGQLTVEISPSILGPSLNPKRRSSTSASG